MNNQKIVWTLGLFLLPLVLLAQIENWVYRYNGPTNSDDRADPVIYGADGNIYAGGYTTTSSHNIDLTVISLNPSGVENWIYKYSNEPLDTNAWASGIVYGSDGNIYISGYSTGDGTGTDIVVISLNDAGTENWVYRYNGPGNDYDIAYSVIYGPDGNLYVAGSSTGVGTDNDFTVISLTTNGTENWIYTYNGPGNLYDYGYGITYGLDGNLYITGHTCGIGSELDITVISLTTAGEERWVYRYNGSGNARDRAFSIVYGVDGNIYTTGYAIGAGTAYDFIVISLTPSGVERWVYLYNGTGNSTDRGVSIVYGPDGNLYACGHSIGYYTEFDLIVISLTTLGTERWVYRYDRQAGGEFPFDEAFSVVYGLDGNIYAAGYSSDAQSIHDFTIVSLTPSGEENWVYWYNGPGNGPDRAWTIVYGADGNLYAAGRSLGSGTYHDFTVISLNPETHVTEEANNSANFFNIYSHPNPFTENTVIRLQIPKTVDSRQQSVVSIKIYDVGGRLVRSFPISQLTDSPINQIIWDGKNSKSERVPAGVYFYRLKTENCTATGKILKAF